MSTFFLLYFNHRGPRDKILFTLTLLKLSGTMTRCSWKTCNWSLWCHKLCCRTLNQLFSIEHTVKTPFWIGAILKWQSLFAEVLRRRLNVQIHEDRHRLLQTSWTLLTLEPLYLKSPAALYIQIFFVGQTAQPIWKFY